MLEVHQIEEATNLIITTIKYNKTDLIPSLNKLAKEFHHRSIQKLYNTLPNSNKKKILDEINSHEKNEYWTFIELVGLLNLREYKKNLIMVLISQPSRRLKKAVRNAAVKLGSDSIQSMYLSLSKQEKEEIQNKIKEKYVKGEGKEFIALVGLLRLKNFGEELILSISNLNTLKAVRNVSTRTLKYESIKEMFNNLKKEKQNAIIKQIILDITNDQKTKRSVSSILLLAELGLKQYEEYLVVLSKDKNKQIRKAACKALRKLNYTFDGIGRTSTTIDYLPATSQQPPAAQHYANLKKSRNRDRQFPKNY